MIELELEYDSNGLIPAIVQDATTAKVLMMGYMNQEALRITQERKKVTFWSRSREEIWTKGERSGNFLHLESMAVDCDHDTILIQAKPDGPTCHTGSDTCWKEDNKAGSLQFISYLENIIDQRYQDREEGSYTSHLFNKGVNKIAQKVGEEAVELVIEAKDQNDDLFLEEASDLLFHYLVLLRNRGMSLTDVADILQKRHKQDA